MGWLGAGVGFVLGRMVGGTIGGLIGAMVGAYWTSEPNQKSWPHSTQANLEAQRLFLASLSALLAKMAKADGRVSEDEIATATHIFQRFQLTREQTNFCIEAFRRAKDDSHSIYEYASDLARIQSDANVREMIYILLWQMATTDGQLSSAEDEMLKNLPRFLQIHPFHYTRCAREFLGAGQQDSASSRDSLAEAYELIGCSPSASDVELKHAYHAKVKKFHPDELQRQGLPQEMIDRANEQMARINAAYTEIKKARGI